MHNYHHSCKITVDNSEIIFSVQGDANWGEPTTLYFNNGVISNTLWKEEGFSTLKLFNDEEIFHLLEGTKKVLLRIFDKLGIQYPSDFILENYHKVVFTNDMHQEVIKLTRMLTNSDFPIDLDSLSQLVSNKIGRQLSQHNKVLMTMKNSPAKEIIQLRISRPQSLDINPLHRDGYLDFYKHTFNLWIPVVGCNQNSSLPVISGSHLWKENDVFRTDVRSAKIDGLIYNVPAIIKSVHGLNAIRPNPSIGEALVFTPFLIHGAAFNKNFDTTRMSFELRFFDEEASF